VYLTKQSDFFLFILSRKRGLKQSALGIFKRTFCGKIKNLEGENMKGEIGVEGMDTKIDRKIRKATNKARRRNCKDLKVWLVI